MSFQNKGFWLPRDAGCLAEDNVGYENSSRIESKRSHQWFMDSSESEIFSNKKQAVEAVNDRPISAMNVSSQRDTNSGFHSLTCQFSDHLFGFDHFRSVNAVDKSMPSIGSGNLNMGSKEFGNQYGNDSSLSISHTIGGSSPCLNFGGIRTVKVNQVRDSDHGMLAASLGYSYSRSENSTISISPGSNDNDDNITSGGSYNNGSDNTNDMGMNKTDENLLPMGHLFNKGDGSFLLMGNNYGKGYESILSMGPSFDSGDRNFITVAQSYGKEDGNLISLGSSYSKGHASFTSMGSTYSKSGENFTTLAPSYDKGTHNLISPSSAYDKTDVSKIPSFDSGISNSLPLSQNHSNCLSSTLSFGGFNVGSEPNPSDGTVDNSIPLMGKPNSAQRVDSSKDLTDSNSDPIVNINTKPNDKIDIVVKNKEPKTTKKTPTNNFPANVKSLLSTCIFDGIPVEYCTWSRERKLLGVIKGTGYLCSCEICKGQKALNAYEFERHAGAKSKHPNNHIFFENGKSVYAVVQELKNTPQEMLFDAIQTVTGSPINQRNFRIWKASFEAATRELQRIYGKDDVPIQS